MRIRVQVLDRQWDGAIRQALGGATGSTVFVERREDFSVEAASAEYPTANHTFWAGSCVEKADRSLTFHSGLIPDQLEPLFVLEPLSYFSRRTLLQDNPAAKDQVYAALPPPVRCTL